MAGTVMPAPKFIGLDNNANPVSGGKLYTYVAGTTTPQATYSDVNLTVANANPVVLDSAGRATVFLSGSSYKFVLKDSDDVTIWTQDNVQAVAPFSTNLDIQGVAGEAILAGQACYLSDGSGALTAGRWYLADADNAYSSSLPQVAMAPDAIDAGETGTFRLQGSVTKSNAQADFVVGDTYYVSATAGLLSLSPGTNLRVMGQADSTTTIVISPNPPNIATTPTFIDGITVTSTDAGAAAAPYLDLYRESASPAASDQIGEIKFSGEDSAGNKQLYARIYGQIADPASTSEDGQVRVATMKAGVETTHLVIDETGQVLPDQAGQALGSATKQFADLFLESGAVVNFDNGNTTLTQSAGKLTLSGSGAGALDVKGAVSPTANDGAALGVSGTAWADLFLASGGVVNWNAGDTTLTHSAGKLTVAGSGAGALDVKGTLSPTANDGAAIGSGTVSWADLFLASGGVINFANGDVTVTHSTNALTFAGAATGYFFNDGPLGVANGQKFNLDGTTGQTYLLRFNNLVIDTYVNNSISFRLYPPAGGESFIYSNFAVDGTLKGKTTISVGNATPASTGAGITFPAAQSASSDVNTLDDYEEGTWTPVIVGSTSAGTATYNVQVGRYQKVGNRVSCDFYIAWSSHTGTGSMTITGLPFTAANITNYYASLCIGFIDSVALTAGNIANGYVAYNTAYITLLQYPTGGGGQSSISVDANGSIIATVSYFV